MKTEHLRDNNHHQNSVIIAMVTVMLFAEVFSIVPECHSMSTFEWLCYDVLTGMENNNSVLGFLKVLTIMTNLT